MNKIALYIASLIAGFSALAQLGVVNLNNNFVQAPPSTDKAFVYGIDNKPLATALGSIEILDSTGAVIKTGKLSSPGLFFLGNTDIPGTVSGGNGSIVIRAWDNSTGTSFDSASVKGSVIVTLTGLGGGTTPAPALRDAGNFQGLHLVPEPSTVALAALGLAGLFFVARRK